MTATKHKNYLIIAGRDSSGTWKAEAYGPYEIPVAFSDAKTDFTTDEDAIRSCKDELDALLKSKEDSE